MAFLDEDGLEALWDDVVEFVAEEAVPPMSPTTRGGAKLDEHGGLVLRDEKLGIGSLVQESDGYARGGIAELTAKGHAEQDTTVGKNLLPNNATSQTVKGVTFTVNADGSVTCNGTASSQSDFYVTPSFNLSSGTYFVSGCPSTSTNSTYIMYIEGRIPASVLSDGRAITVEDSDTLRLRIVVRSGVTVSNVTFYPQLELGSTATAYEPYTGGAPSPSPDYPQEIQVVRGRNLFANRIDNMSINGQTGRVFVNVAGAITFVAKVSRNTDYIVSSSTGNRMVVSGVPSLSPSENEGTLIVTDNNVKTLAFNSGGNDYIAVYLGINVSIDDAQLELGSTPTPYVPYGHVGMEAQGKNLVDQNAFTSGYWDASTGEAASSTNWMKTPKIKVVQGDYVVRGEFGSSFGRIVAYAQDGSYISELTSVSISNVSRRFTIPNGTSFIAFYFNSYTDTNTIALTKGPEEQPYEPYFHTTTPIPLPSRGWVGSLPDGTADVLTLDGAGKVEWELDTNEVVLDGSESWVLSGGLKCRAFTFPAQRAKNGNSGDVVVNGYCTRFVAKSDNATYAGEVGFSFHTSNGSIAITPFGATEITVADFKSWLSTHPVTILYPLATPVTEDCGYVDLPDIPSDVTVSIPELDALGVKYFVDDSAGTLARQWYERAYAEIGQAVVELAQRVAALES